MESFSSASYSKWDDDHAWSSQEWNTEIKTYDRSGRPDKTSWWMVRKVRLDHEEILLDGTAQSVRNEETLRDRSGLPDDINSREEARPQQFVIGNDETELELSVESRSFVNCKHYTSKYRKWLRKFYMKTMATGKSYENKCATNYSIITNNNWNNAYNKQLTRHDTNDDVDTLHLHFNGRVACMHWDCTRTFVPQRDDDTAHLMAQVLSAFTFSPTVIFMGASLWLASPRSTSTSSSCLSPSSSSTSSCSLSSTTRSSWQTCAAPLHKRVRTPWTPSPPTQLMSSSSWPSASSTTHQFPSPSWSLPRTRTWMTWHSARCSPRHTEDKSTTACQKACQSVSRRRL